MPDDVSCPSTSSRSTPALLDWLSANGVWLSPKLRIDRLESDGDVAEINVGVFANDSIESDEIVCKIPKHILLSRKTSSIGNHPAFLHLSEILLAKEIHPQPDTILLTVVLLYEMLLGTGSRWSVYIDSLPSAADLRLPSFWTDAAVSRWLEGTDVVSWQKHVGSTPAILTDLYNSLVQPLFRDLAKSSSLNAFLHAYSLVSSRAFYVDNYHELCMAPLADIFNHHFDPLVCMQADDLVCNICGSYVECEHDQSSDTRSKLPDKDAGAQEEMVEMVAMRTAGAGDEVLNTYGTLNNARLLAEYGFLLEANDADRVCWFSLEQLASDAGCPVATVTDSWQMVCKEPARPLSDDRIASVATQSGQLQDMLWIDAEGRIAGTLWLLVEQMSATRAGADSIIVNICKKRIDGLHGADVDNLYSRLDAADLSRLERLAIQRNIEERSLLSSCLHIWQDDMLQD